MHSRRIEENGDKIYSSQFETNRVIENLVSGLNDEYTYYRSPSIDDRYEYSSLEVTCDLRRENGDGKKGENADEETVHMRHL